jgi:hypothetical protein
MKVSGRFVKKLQLELRAGKYTSWAFLSYYLAMAAKKPSPGNVILCLSVLFFIFIYYYLFQPARANYQLVALSLSAPNYYLLF